MRHEPRSRRQRGRRHLRLWSARRYSPHLNASGRVIIFDQARVINRRRSLSPPVCDAHEAPQADRCATDQRGATLPPGRRGTRAAAACHVSEKQVLLGRADFVWRQRRASHLCAHLMPKSTWEWTGEAAQSRTEAPSRNLRVMRPGYRCCSCLYLPLTDICHATTSTPNPCLRAASAHCKHHDRHTICMADLHKVGVVGIVALDLGNVHVVVPIACTAVGRANQVSCTHQSPSQARGAR